MWKRVNYKTTHNQSNKMKNASYIPEVGLLLAFLSMIALSCNDDKNIEEHCKSDVKSIEDAQNKAEGSWSLITVKSGWTGERKPSDNQVTIKIDNKQKVTIYDDSKELGNMQLMFSNNNDRFTYTTSNLSGSSGILVLSDSILSVCNEQLILDNTTTDGGLYTFERKK